MTTKLLLACGGVGALIVFAYIGLALYSHRTPVLGLEGGKLRACPGTPNCVVSEAAGASIKALLLPENRSLGWASLVAQVESAGGTIHRNDGSYLHATFQSRWLRFVDDLEARLDAQAGVVHVRAAARVGYSDRGINAARVESLRQAVSAVR